VPEGDSNPDVKPRRISRIEMPPEIVSSTAVVPALESHPSV